MCLRQPLSAQDRRPMRHGRAARARIRKTHHRLSSRFTRRRWCPRFTPDQIGLCPRSQSSLIVSLQLRLADGVTIVRTRISNCAQASIPAATRSSNASPTKSSARCRRSSAIACCASPPMRTATARFSPCGQWPVVSPAPAADSATVRPRLPDRVLVQGARRLPIVQCSAHGRDRGASH